MDSVQNVVSNAAVAVDFRKPYQLYGTVSLVAVEVLVSKIVRSILKMENRSITELAFIHLLSIPFMGGIAAPFGAGSDIRNTADYATAVKDGAKGVPGVLLAQWVVNTAYKGIHFPWFNLKDLMITAGSKTLTRPLVYSIIDKLPADVQMGFDVLDNLFRAQIAGSNLSSSDD